MRKFGNVDGWNGMLLFFLLKFAENAVIDSPDSNSITFAGSLESQHMKIFYAPWLLRIAAITGHLSVMSLPSLS